MNNEEVSRGTYPLDGTYGRTQEQIIENIKRENANINFDNDPNWDYQINLGEGATDDNGISDTLMDGYTITRTPAVYQEEVIGSIIDDQVPRDETVENYVSRTFGIDLNSGEYRLDYNGANDYGDNVATEINVVRRNRIKPNPVAQTVVQPIVEEPVAVAQTVEEPEIVAQTVEEPVAVAQTVEEPEMVAQAVEEPVVETPVVETPVASNSQVIPNNPVTANGEEISPEILRKAQELVEQEKERKEEESLDSFVSSFDSIDLNENPLISFNDLINEFSMDANEYALKTAILNERLSHANNYYENLEDSDIPLEELYDASLASLPQFNNRKFSELTKEELDRIQSLVNDANITLEDFYNSGLVSSYEFGGKDFDQLDKAELDKLKTLYEHERTTNPKGIKNIAKNKYIAQLDSLKTQFRRRINNHIATVTYIENRIKDKITSNNHRIEHLKEVIKNLEEERQDPHTSFEKAQELGLEVAKYRKEIEKLTKNNEFLEKYSTKCGKLKNELENIKDHVNNNNFDPAKDMVEVNKIGNTARKVAEKLANKAGEQTQEQEQTNEEEQTQEQGPEQPGEDQTQEQGPEQPGEDQTQEQGPEQPGEDQTQEQGPEQPGEDQTQEQGPEQPGEEEQDDYDLNDITPFAPEMKGALKAKYVKRSKFHKRELRGLIVGAAALGLGLVAGPLGAPAVASAANVAAALGFGYTGVNVIGDVYYRVRDAATKFSVNHKMKRVAKSLNKLMEKNNNDMKFSIEKDYDTGRVRLFVNIDGEKVLYDPNVNNMAIGETNLNQYIQDLLDKKFKYQQAKTRRKGSRYAIRNFPDVTISTLEAAYIGIGGFDDRVTYNLNSPVAASDDYPERISETVDETMERRLGNNLEDEEEQEIVSEQTQTSEEEQTEEQTVNPPQEEQGEPAPTQTSEEEQTQATGTEQTSEEQTQEQGPEQPGEEQSQEQGPEQSGGEQTEGQAEPVTESEPVTQPIQTDEQDEFEEKSEQLESDIHDRVEYLDSIGIGIEKEQIDTIVRRFLENIQNVSDPNLQEDIVAALGGQVIDRENQVPKPLTADDLYEIDRQVRDNLGIRSR